MRSKRLDDEVILDRLRQHKTELNELGVERIGLFGSYANGTQKSESDVDILAQFDEVSFDAYMDLKFFLEDLFDRDVDLVIEADLKPSLQHVRDEAEYVATA